MTVVARIQRVRCVGALFVASCLMVSSPILAQAPTSVLEGTVRDTGGGVVIGATVTVRDVDTSRSRTGVTDAGE